MYGKEGFIRTLSAIQDADKLEVHAVSTDRRTLIKKLMRIDPCFKDIIHEFDLWNIAKSIMKKILKASKTTLTTRSWCMFPRLRSDKQYPRDLCLPIYLRKRGSMPWN